ncbi:uncharacterized protein LOC123520196 isoform X2 [Portunus trituberculatus]|uniref:uncharacterized protein LOC123520196 isoform X2 n=1 Tax=Portunus trituberculatus TaxID=210409 RepID=UPI001E1CFEA0|nr:uncharacterized protein LOC123520196 isoform X2 [Portunus trituberculatus]
MARILLVLVVMFGLGGAHSPAHATNFTTADTVVEEGQTVLIRSTQVKGGTVYFDIFMKAQGGFKGVEIQVEESDGAIHSAWFPHTRNVALSQTQSQAPVTSPPHQHQHTTGQGRTTNNYAEPLYCDILPDVTDTAAPGRPTDQVIERFYYYEILPDLSARRVAVVGPRAGEDTQGPPTHIAPPLPPRYENLPPHSDAASLHGHMQAAAVRGAPLYATMPSRGTRSALYTKTNSNVL